MSVDPVVRVPAPVSAPATITLGYPGPGSGMIKLTRLQQSQFVNAFPKVFSPVKGGWGLRGATHVTLRAATPSALQPALFEAWRNNAPSRLLAR